ncbi:hypothetical protein NDU88_008133 [Pleurodeles waltl]|uniref:Uncharacterized protein n=1 Tax=Pleurodeles waltl TaxID=8319 RepID=A0AAV7RX36_PLEWA|nr:hypothetical protein NDU88_008133 [Pleurodeles waltl]
MSDPHNDLACAVAAPNATEATREDGLLISSLPPPWDLKVVKKRLPPFHGQNDGIWSWRLKETTGEEERRLRRTLPRKTPKPHFGRADRRWDPEQWRPITGTRTAGPGEHTSEPPRFRRSMANQERRDLELAFEGDDRRRGTATTEDAAPEDAEAALRESGPTLGSRAVEAHYRDEDRWPRGAHE